VSIEAAEGVTTGISAADRAAPCRLPWRPTPGSDLVQPGHIFPLQAVDGGVLMRAGHTEAGCDLAAMAGCTPAAVICEIMKDDGTMARLPDLQLFAAHGLKIGTIADLIEYRSRTERWSKRSAPARCHGAGRVHRPRLPRPAQRRAAPGAGAGPVGARGRGAGARARAAVGAGRAGRAARHAQLGLHEALARIRQEGCGVAVLLNCGESADQLLAQFQGTARATHAPRAGAWTCAATASARKSCARWACSACACWARRAPAQPGGRLRAGSGRLHHQGLNMLEADKGRSAPLDGSGLRIAIVQARFNEGVTNGLRDACLAELAALGVARGNIAHHTVPGRWRCRWPCGGWRTAASTTRCRAGLHHPRRDLSLRAGRQRIRRRHHARAGFDIPIANAILTTEDLEQATVRQIEKGATPPAWPSRWPCSSHLQ
jgi:hypothetical protein